MNEIEVLIRRSRATVISLGAIMVTDVAAILAGIAYADYLGSLPSESIVAELELAPSEGWYALVGVAQLAVLLFPVVFFLRWFRLCYVNAGRITGEGTQHHPRWVFWGFLTPIANLFFPYQLMREIWEKSIQKWDQEPSRVLGLSEPRDVVSAWWGAFITASLIANLVARFSWDAATAQEELYATNGALLSDSIDLVAAALAIMLVRNVTSLQKPLLAEATLRPDA